MLIDLTKIGAMLAVTALLSACEAIPKTDKTLANPIKAGPGEDEQCVDGPNPVFPYTPPGNKDTYRWCKSKSSAGYAQQDRYTVGASLTWTGNNDYLCSNANVRGFILSQIGPLGLSGVCPGY